MPFFITKKKWVSQPIIYKQRQRKVRKSGREGGGHADSNDSPTTQKHKNIKLVLNESYGPGQFLIQNTVLSLFSILVAIVI